MRRIVPAFLLLALAAGCSRNGGTPAPDYGPLREKVLLPKEPEGAKGVLAARKAVKDGDAVVVVGRIGGDKHQTFIKDRASFTIVDPSLVPCNEREDDECPTPWDYCCDPPEVIREASAFVKFVDDNGETIAADARELFRVKELQTVVVRGRAKRDEAGNFTVLADALHVRPDKGAAK